MDSKPPWEWDFHECYRWAHNAQLDIDSALCTLPGVGTHMTPITEDDLAKNPKEYATISIESYLMDAQTNRGQIRDLKTPGVYPAAFIADMSWTDQVQFHQNIPKRVAELGYIISWDEDPILAGQGSGIVTPQWGRGSVTLYIGMQQQ